MNKLLIVLLVLVIVLYVRYNLRHQEKYEILQLPSSKLTPDILAERNPIIVTDFSDEPRFLIRKAFRYQYTYVKEVMYTAGSDKIIKNYGRYAIISMTSSNKNTTLNVEVINPKYKQKNEYQSVLLKVRPSHVLVLPMFWRFKLTIEDSQGMQTDFKISCLYVNDMFSSMYQSLSM